MASDKRHATLSKQIAIIVVIIFIVVAAVAYVRDPLSPVGPIQPRKPPMVLEVHALQQQIERGDIQLVIIRASDGQNIIPGIRLEGNVNYPSGESDAFSGNTDSQGRFIMAWPVPPWSEAGTVEVTVSGVKQGYANGVGRGFFRILPSEAVYIPYNGMIILDVQLIENGTRAAAALEFNPPTTSGVFLFIEKPDGEILKKRIADPEVEIQTLTPTIEIDMPGKWRFWAMSNGAASSVKTLTVPKPA